MAYGSVLLIPGVNTERTQAANEAGFSQSNMVRWKDGQVEKLGGWVRFYSSPVNGMPRDLHAWQDLSSNTHLSIGTTSELDVISSGVLQTITPQKTITDTSPNFSTTTGSATITIVDSNVSSPTTNNSVFFDTPVSVGGVILNGLYAIKSIISSDSYTISATTNASALVSNGGAVPYFETTTSSPTITVHFNDHGEAVGDTVDFLVSTTVASATIYGTYTVNTVPDINSYTITASTQANAATTASMNSGKCEFVYYVTIGPQSVYAGYGTNTYGTGSYGIGIAGAVGTGTPITATDWTTDNWGEILVACPQNGPIFTWSPNSGFQNASIISQAPIQSGGIFVAMPQQILVAWGSSVTGFQDPLQVRWSDSQDYTNWTAGSNSFAGSFHIPTGSIIKGGLQVPLQALIWTDIDVYSMQYVNLPLVFGFTKLMSGCGLISSHAAVVMSGATYWMSQKQFFVLPAGGSPRPLPCSVWDAVFQNLNTSYVANIRAWANSGFNEIWWHYPSSASSGENDSYVKMTVTAQGYVWDYGQLPTGRTACIDQSVLGSPIATDPTGLIFQHEQGYNGDGIALNPYFVTGDWRIGEGEDISFVDQFNPDFRYGLFGGSQSATMLWTFYARDFPNGSVRTYGPYSVPSSVEYITPRVRGRLVAVRGESQDSGSFWRIGRPQYRWAADGRR